MPLFGAALIRLPIWLAPGRRRRGRQRTVDFVLPLVVSDLGVLRPRPKRIVAGRVRFCVGGCKSRYRLFGHPLVPMGDILRIVREAADLLHDGYIDGWDVGSAVVVANIEFNLFLSDESSPRQI